jgi:hypothetical protein
MNHPVARFCLTLAVVLSAASALAAPVKYGWFGADAPGARSLFYGALPAAGEAPNPETIQLLLRCADKGKAIVVFIAETSAAVKPGEKLRVALSIARIRSTAVGRTMANQLSGVPSIRVTFPLHARVFAAMTEPRLLSIRAGGWQRKVPLTGLDGRLKRLVAACGK